jgi:quinol monooxygenase YgiN
MTLLAGSDERVSFQSLFDSRQGPPASFRLQGFARRNRKLVKMAVISLMAVLGLFFGALLRRGGNSGAAFAGANAKEPAFSLLVTLQFASDANRREFLELVEPLAAHVEKREPSTVSYAVLQSDRDPLKMLILERYRDKETAYLQTHRSSAPFRTFRPQLQAMQEAGKVTVTGESFLDTTTGFVRG